MTDLDAATGLPELPEGQFWRVSSLASTRPNSDYSRLDFGSYEYFSPASAGPTHALSLMETVTVPARKRRFLRPVKPITSTSMVRSKNILAIENLPHTLPNNSVNVDAAAAKVLKKIGGGVVATRYYGFFGFRGSRSDGVRCAVNNEVSPETIRRTALEILASIEESARVAKENAEAKARAEEEAKREEAEQLAEAARRDAYNGDYPPRILID